MLLLLLRFDIYSVLNKKKLISCMWSDLSTILIGPNSSLWQVWSVYLATWDLYTFI